MEFCSHRLRCEWLGDRKDLRYKIHFILHLIISILQLEFYSNYKMPSVNQSFKSNVMIYKLY